MVNSANDDNRDLDEIFPNSTLQTVACEVRFPVLLKISDFITEFQSKVREKLQKFKTGREQIISADGLLVEVLIWEFSTDDAKSILKIRNNSISFISKNYKEFNPFFNDIKEYFREFFTQTKIENLSRIGIRYSNVHTFKKGESIEQLLKYFKLSNLTINLEDKISSIDSRITREIGEKKIHTLYKLIKDRDGIYQFLFDYDCFSSESIKYSDLFTIIEDLRRIILKTFHDNITNKFIDEVLRAGN